MILTNAKDEFLKHTENKAVLCAYIAKDIRLRVGWNEEELAVFLNALDYGYDSRWGSQQLYGTIWYDDGTWSDRGEYHGIEWWEFHKCPEIPLILINP